jgi:hypothetical protein
MVNTFLPYSDFAKTASVLDNKRLGKQRVEAKQIIDIIEKLKPNTAKLNPIAWGNHPAVRQWIGYANALKSYYNCIVKEWIARGFVNNMKLYKLPKHITMPWFVNSLAFTTSHQAALLRKLPTHYEKYFTVPKQYLQHTYLWPSKLSEEQKKEISTIPYDKLDLKKYTAEYPTGAKIQRNQKL